MHFDVVFTRPSVFVDVPLVSAMEKSNYFRNSIYRECSLLGDFNFGKARVSSVDFAMCNFDVILYLG